MYDLEENFAQIHLPNWQWVGGDAPKHAHHPQQNPNHNIIDM